LLDDPNASVALGAAKEILDRNLGKVKQQVQVDVTSTHVLHLQALEELAERKRRQIIEAQTIDITPVSVSASVSDNPDITLDRIVSHDDQGVIDASESAIVTDAIVEAPRPPEAPGAAAYAPTTLPTHENPTTEPDKTT
jgi:DNA replication initiation complex subunit (GINS family)